MRIVVRPPLRPSNKFNSSLSFIVQILHLDNVYCIEDTLFFYRIRKGTMTKSMTPHMEFTLKKIVSNHPDIYENYLTDIIWLKRLVEYYRDGLPYRIGAKILRPYRFIKSFFTGRKYIDK